MSERDERKQRFGITLFGVTPTAIVGLALLLSIQGSIDPTRRVQAQPSRATSTSTSHAVTSEAFVPANDLPDLW